MSKYIEEGVGKIRRRPDPARISGEYITQDDSNDVFLAEEDRRIFEAAQQFEARFPRGSIVYRNRRRVEYGETVNCMAYIDPSNPVLVIDVNGIPNTMAHWETAPLVLKED